MTKQSISKRTLPPFRCDVVGSYLRPDVLKQARVDYAAGKINVEALKQVEDEAIKKLVQQQKQAGLKVITDGEFRRSWWHLDFMWGLQGVEKAAIEKGYVFNGEETRAETARLSGKISGKQHPFVEQFIFIQQFAENDIVPRQTLPAPAQFLAELQRPENRASTQAIYANEKELEKDIANAYRTIFQDLYAAGCRNIQLDDCTWGMLVDPTFGGSGGASTPKSECSCGTEHILDQSQNVKQLAEQYLAINNAVLSDFPTDLCLTTHVCRGNYHSTWASSGGYEPVAEILFAKENVSAYYLEFDTERSGDFTPLASVPKDKLVVLGLISSKLGGLEHKEEVIQRIHEASNYVDLDRLCLSTQCGFASTEEGNILTEEQQWAKIQLVNEIAQEVWGA